MKPVFGLCDLMHNAMPKNWFVRVKLNCQLRMLGVFLCCVLMSLYLLYSYIVGCVCQ